MNEDSPKPPEIDEELSALEEQILSLANIVENTFADAVVALMESDSGAASQAQREDYKAHQIWLQADSMALDLLSSGQLQLKQVKKVAADTKIAHDLKVMADEGIRIAHLMRACPTEGDMPACCTELLPEMIEMAQSIFGDSVDAFVNRDATEAKSQDFVFRQLSSQHEELINQVNTELDSPEAPLNPEVATSLVLVSRSLEIIGERSLDMANHVAKLCGDRNSNHVNDLDGDIE
ncbi:MAG: phosphate signaling complex PhoU family protein [Planctomycetota bacterium]